MTWETPEQYQKLAKKAENDLNFPLAVSHLEHALLTPNKSKEFTFDDKNKIILNLGNDRRRYS